MKSSFGSGRFKVIISNYQLVGFITVGLMFAIVASGPGRAEESSLNSAILNEQIAAVKAQRAEEEKLDKLLKELAKEIPKSGHFAFKMAHRYWQKSAGKDCDLERKFVQGGSIASVVYSRCMTKHLSQRIEYLRPFLCEGQGMTGTCEAAERYQ